jgi:hypothetical protein
MEATHDWSSLYVMKKEGQIISESIYLLLERNGYRIQKPLLKKKIGLFLYEYLQEFII